MLVINSNAAPSVVVNARIPGHLIDEDFVFGMSYRDKEELYNMFCSKDKEEWSKDERIIEMIQTIKDILIEDRDAIITFRFDDEFIKEQERQQELMVYLDSVAKEDDNEDIWEDE